MQPMINLVATRLKAGKSDELLRWYNDHVNILMRCEALNGASLYRRTSADQAAPEYVCLYDFPSLNAFMAFEASEAKESARQVIEAGWGKGGIEITQRTQYVTGGKWSGQGADAAASMPTTLSPLASGFHIQCLDMSLSSTKAAHDVDDLKRWMADSLYVAAAQCHVSHYAWHASANQAIADEQGKTQVIVVASSASATSQDAWRSWWDMSAADHLGQAPSKVQVQWQSGYERVSAWRR